MSTQPKVLLTSEEYLERERKAEYKSEYIAGDVVAMAGASLRHNRITFNLVEIFGPQIRQHGCQHFGMDARVKVKEAALYTYPDLAVVCGKPEFEDAELDTLLNPVLIIEILSPSTERYDRGAKFAMYRKLETLQEYVLVAQDAAHMERYVRQSGNQWVMSEVDSLDASLQLSSVPAVLPLRDVYRDVELPG